MILVWVSSVAFATGQDFYTVYRGSVHEYKIAKNAFEVTYNWQVFTDVTLINPANNSQAVMSPLGAGRENEIQVKWNGSGDYYLMVTVNSLSGCANRKAWHFVVDQTDDKPTARIAGNSIVMLGNCNVTGYVLDASSSNGGGLTFTWSPSAYLDNAASSKPTFIPGKTTRYHLTVSDSRGQVDTTSVLIVVNNQPKAVTDKNVFVNEPNADILLSGSKSTGVGLTYLWQSKDGIIRSGETTAMAEVSGLGMYYLKVTDTYGCTSQDSVWVGLYTQAVMDTSSTKLNFAVDINVLANDMPKGELNPATLKIVTAPQNGIATVVGDSLVSYLPNQYYTGSDNFIYSICDYFEHCDQATVLVLVSDAPFFIPEAFSPNGDGINDKFEIKGIAKYKTVQIEIFNRWGNVVYRSDNYGEGQGKSGFWDGKAGQGVRVGSGSVPTGTYFYVLKLDGKEKINGAIYLDR
ncbi:cadherin domain protein [Aquipluma nitroreducens]|uniref:Cadherin domain protein n=1 Tax=Aquipluma nitroreducens TaxID=2010828 RepID=A0A5K7S862_9BACT|nr:gliding motility-associated C-terminal domain-containing protein [Aquipluma nitroreducens]BBE17675.1 cadherin domain protein [Aquipluma nitroreducens]